MKRRILASVLAVVMLFTTATGAVSAEEQGENAQAATVQKNDSPLRLWYTSPAPVKTSAYDSTWQSNMLPLGNGYMGGMVFGGIEKERIHFNDKTLWTGGPSQSRPDYNGGNRTQPVS